MQTASDLISSIYKSRNVITTLMEKQGYNVDEYEHFSISDVNLMYQNKQLDMLIEKKEEDKKSKRKQKVYISYYLGKTLRSANIQEMIDDLFNLEETLTKDDTLYIITKDEMNETMVNYLKHLWETEGIFVVVQNIRRLQFNILEHSMVPPHRIMSDEEIEEVKTRYNITEMTQFPDISRFDPVSQAICLRPGQVCEITRASKTAVQSMYYRYCI